MNFIKSLFRPAKDTIKDTILEGTIIADAGNENHGPIHFNKHHLTIDSNLPPEKKDSYLIKSALKDSSTKSMEYRPSLDPSVSARDKADDLKKISLVKHEPSQNKVAEKMEENVPSGSELDSTSSLKADPNDQLRSSHAPEMINPELEEAKVIIAKLQSKLEKAPADFKKTDDAKKFIVSEKSALSGSDATESLRALDNDLQKATIGFEWAKKNNIPHLDKLHSWKQEAALRQKNGDIKVPSPQFQVITQIIEACTQASTADKKAEELAAKLKETHQNQSDTSEISSLERELFEAQNQARESNNHVHLLLNASFKK